MKFSTTVDIHVSSRKISHEHKILTLGSCFAQHMGEKFKYYCFDAFVNPYGVQYNPASIAQGIKRLISGKIFETSDFFQHGSLWNSFQHSNLYSKSDLTDVQSAVNQSFILSSEALKVADYLIITPGTAWIYEFAATGELVSNCHKLPASDFNRKRLSVEEIVDLFSTLFDELLNLNHQLCVIFSISPVRHWKDGAHENNVSKAILLLAVEKLISKYPKHSDYFPAYEIMMDELRDYRFYADDMIHPSAVSIDYIWECFSERYFDKETKGMIRDVENHRKLLEHRPIHQDSDETLRMKNSVERMRASLIEKYPVLKGRL